MLTRLEECQVSIHGTLVDAMRSLEKSNREIVLVVDETGVLKGTLTDGDIRRALLKGSSLNSSLEPHFSRQFTFVTAKAGRAEVLDLMKARALGQIPVVDDAGMLTGLHLLSELIGCAPKPNCAIVMAGGKGLRLRPFTENVPKPMIPVAGRPILERLVLHVVGHGIRHVFLAVNYLSHIIEDHFGGGEAFGCRIEYLREDRPLGTGGALTLLPQRPAHPFLVLNGDLVTEANIGAMLEVHERNRNIATLGVRAYTHTVPFGCVEVSGGIVRSFEEKPLLRRLVNTGMYVLDPVLLDRIPSGVEFPITNLFDDSIARGERLGAYEVEEDWIDVGQREQLRLAREGTA